MNLYLDLKALCVKMNCSPDFARKHYTQHPTFPGQVIGKRWRESEVDEWLAANKVSRQVRRRKRGSTSGGSGGPGARPFPLAPARQAS